MRINIDTIKDLMQNRGLSQVDLSQRTRLGTKTIGRACSGKELRTSNVERIAKELSIAVEELTKTPSDPISDEVKKKPGLSRLVMDLDHTTMNKLQSAARRYQVQPKTIVKFAPLLFSLIAEASLAERARHLRDWEAKMKTLIDAAPASSDIRADLETRIAEASKCEQASIDQCDLHGGFSSARQAETVHSFLPEGVSNPFLSFLKGLSGSQHFVIDSDSIDHPEYWLKSLVDFGEAEFCARTEFEEMANVAVHEETVSLLDVPAELQQPHRAEDRTRWLASYLGDANGNFERARTVWQESGLAEQWLTSNNLIRFKTVSRSEDTQDGAYEQTRS